MVKDKVQFSEEATEKLSTGKKPAEAQEQADAEKEAVEEVTLTDEELVALCKASVCPSCNEKEQADEERLRALAEMDNFKKRIQRDKEEHMKYASESVLSDLLPILDNLRLAIEYGKNIEGCKDMLIGVEMTQKLFLDAIARHGLEPVGNKGEEFNPETHEAVAKEACEETPEGFVKTLMQPGYKLKERLLRPAKVVVSSGPA